MMLKILKDRFIRLGRDEDGVAFVITLGVFMFLYVACASVYAVGMAVKEKMHLQGACDAAAYSAAIVQADTFSRIATINRAMSWTYQQMTKRQMDYIVWQWLEETIEHYNFDRNAARQYAWNNNRCSNGGKCNHPFPCYGQGTGWNCSDISLEGNSLRGPYTEAVLRNWARSGFPASLRANSGSFYSRSATLNGLGLQIDDDLLNIYRMSEAVDQLARSLPRRIDDATSAILRANIPNYMTQGDCQYFINQDSSPRTSYFRTFSNTAHDEMIFISYDNNEVKTPSAIFGAGADSWFVRGDGAPRDGGAGIHRSYDHKRPGPPLRANWTWWATGWTCGTTGPYHWRIPNGFKTFCRDSHDTPKCECTNAGAFFGRYISGVRQTTGFDGSVLYNPIYSSSIVRRQMQARCSADNNRRYDNRFMGIRNIPGRGRQIVRARPLKLTEDYFGRAGTITVGLARRNENPWFSIFGRVTGGMYSAFSPVADSWTFCFASAKAGYKLYHEPNDWYINAHLGSKHRTRKLDDWEEKLNGNVRAENGPRDYCIDWKEEESKFAGWYWEYKKDESGRYVRDRNGRRIRETLVTQWTAPSELNPSWRQSWNLVQDDWDAVMIPVRQGGSRAEEVDRWKEDHGQEWDAFWWDWMRQLRHRSRGYRGYESAKDRYPVRYEPVWQPGGVGNIASMLNNANWQRISGRGRSVPNTSVTAGPTYGDGGDPLGGRLAGQIWDDHWRRGIPPPTATGTSQWNIGSPGANLDWNQIENEMYH